MSHKSSLVKFKAIRNEDGTLLPMKKEFDVLGLGCTAVDEILYVAEYPSPDSKIEISRRERRCGGLCATALVAAARLSARCAYAGTLGDDPDSDFVKKVFEKEGVDTRLVVVRPGMSPVHSTVIVDESRHTRTILYDPKSAQGADPHLPEPRMIASSRVLLVDRFGLPGMLRATRIARLNGVHVVGDFESRPTPGVRSLIRLTNHLIVSADFACSHTGARVPSKAAARLWSGQQEVVVVTCGGDGCWVRDRTSVSPRQLPAFKVSPVDTTGCGDVFHGAYAAALSWGWPVDRRLLFASASAALKAGAQHGPTGIPNRKAVEKFLKIQKRSLGRHALE